MKFLSLFTLTALSCSTALAKSHFVLNDRDFTLPDRHLLRALARRQHSNGTSISELRALSLDASHQFLNTRQTTGRCGANYGRCGDNLCCSDYGYCGDSVDHCYPGFDCQPAYGVCGWPRPVATTSTTSTSTRPTSTSTSTTSTRPTTTSTTTTTSTRSTSSTSSYIPLPTGIITTNGQCGNSTICPGIADAGWGPCCSQFFWCGSGPEYCGAGCQSAFGLCDDSPPPPGTTSTTTSSSTSTTSSTTSSIRITTTSTTSTTSTRTSTTTSARPTFTLPPGQVSSRDGRCGNGQNCLGSTYGRCCSQFGWCGEGDQFCPYIVGCQTEFGYCDPQ
ncbi:hypothetical protein B0T09DRAFT_169729 [Sordaria sp. MPI-SDFR-AT-0083]|nr:hypothetical protein B0T09DRAFT_169729 [Sordaria sp. MPI-SDFR-AT-0083]